MTRLNYLQNLLDRIYLIQETDQKAKSESLGNEAQYKVFEVLGLWVEETKLHTKFIADLLNPDGMHGQKDLFLKTFIQQCEKERQEYLKKHDSLHLVETPETASPFHLSTSNAITEVEYCMRSNQSSSAGKIDLLIRNQASDSEMKGILIENNINTEDTPSQLAHYNDFAKTALKGGYQMLYLTLDGRYPSVQTIGKTKQVPYLVISYQKTIIEWLECSLQFINDSSILYETIRQYLVLIKQLTSHTMSLKTKDKLIDMIASDPKNLSAALILSTHMDEIKEKVISRFVFHMAQKTATKGLVHDVKEISFAYKDFFIHFGLNDDHSTYVSIKDKSSLQGKSIPESAPLRCFDQQPDPWNPYGYRVCLNQFWDTEGFNLLYQQMVETHDLSYYQTDLFCTVYDWIEKLKTRIDRF